MSSTDARFPEPTTTGTVAFRGHETWYRVTGELDPSSDRAPVVTVHGGPGGTHHYMLTMANLAEDGRAVIHYDQIGNGASTHLPDAEPSFWTVELFIEELHNLVTALGIADRFHLVGQSWGGMLTPEFVLAHPDGVRSLTICDSPASMALWLAAAAKLRADLPQNVQATLTEHEEAGTTDSTEYEEAMQVFYDRHVCRIIPNPSEVAETFRQIKADPTVYGTMNGPSEFHVIGSIKDWSIIDRLPGITAPTLVIAGAHDEAQPETWAPFVKSIPDARTHVFPQSSHMPHVEEMKDWLEVVGDFIRAND